MITVISGTNRPDSRTIKFARHVFADLKGRTEEAVELLDLCDLDHDFLSTDMYDPEKAPASLRKIQEELIIGADKLIFVCPEYNGSFPGVLKAFIDALSVHRTPDNFKHKPISLIGVASGRAGNLRGLDHLAGILLHMGAHLVQDKLPISQAQNLLDENGKVSDEGTISAIAKQTAYLASI